MSALSALVLVVDDRIEDARLAQTLLESRGHKVTIETDGKKAIQILRSDTQFDVTFLDLLLPDVNGEQIYQALRAYAPARLKRLVFFTGMAYLAETWLSRTGIPVIEKGPESPDTLFRTVQQFAKMDCSRGPFEKDAKGEERRMPPKTPSNPELAAIFDEDVEVDTGMINLAAKKGVSSSFITELRIRHLHSSHKALKEDVTSIKEDVSTTKGDLKTLQTEISTTIKTSTKIIAGVVVCVGLVAGFAAWFLEHVVLKK